MIQIQCKDKMTDIVTWLVTVSLLRARSDKFKKKSTVTNTNKNTAPDSNKKQTYRWSDCEQFPSG